MNRISLPGINIQTPWAELLVTGKKQIETRNYKLPERYSGKPLVVIETPGKSKKFDARIIGIIIFSGSKKYHNFDAWRSDYSLHLVSDNDPTYCFNSKKAKYGWIVSKAVFFDTFPKAPRKRGIVYATQCLLNPTPEVLEFLK